AAGWKAVCIPTAEVVHYGGQSTGQVRPQSVVNLWDARLKLYRKHYPTITNLLARLLIRAGMNRSIRQVARWGRSSNDEEHAHALVDAYRTVIRLTREQTP
ncbi:MAG: glycosyltransferase family 2 protein, partial [Anaerolineae bacterium]